jgi:hypothetical protein
MWGGGVGKKIMGKNLIKALIHRWLFTFLFLRRLEKKKVI